MSEYVTKKRCIDPDWETLYAWEQANPMLESEGFNSWYARRKVVMDRIWVGYCLPQFKDTIWSWSEEQVKTARQFVSGLFCGVCGRQEDPGCILGC